MAKRLEDHNYFGIDATVLADSKNQQGDRIITFMVTIPRIVLAEFNTHRMLSRNSRSSRAVPFKKMLKEIIDNPFIPIAWQKDHSGMQGTEYWTDEIAEPDHHSPTEMNFTELQPVSRLARWWWLTARRGACIAAKALNRLKITKQLCNRLLEPFMYHTIICTATEYENFFKLRCPQYKFEQKINEEESVHYFRSKKDYITHFDQFFSEDLRYTHIVREYDQIEWLNKNTSGAEIHIQAAAEAMWDSMNESQPKELKGGEWHIPFNGQFTDEFVLVIDQFLSEGGNDEESINEVMRKVAVARCARLSYQNFDGTIDFEKDLKLYDRLAKLEHWSPFEHVAQAMTENEYEGSLNDQIIGFFKAEDGKVERGWNRNFKGFKQIRAKIDN